MLTRTDNASEIGMHVFERAGLGKAPFRMVGFREAKYQAAPGAPVQPGTSCDYCGQGIMYVCEIEGADKRQFKVGCDCVRKTGDAGLLRAYKNRPEVRAAAHAKREERDQRVIAEWAALIGDSVNRERLSKFTVTGWNGVAEPWIAFAERAWGWCGMAGRARYLKAAKKILAGAA